MLDPKNLVPGQEQYERFNSHIRKNPWRYQYDYRHPGGELFSCIKKTLAECRVARDEWLRKKG